MSKISEAEFARICEQIRRDREQICQLKPNAPHAEILLWMLLGCLIAYLNLTEAETPCFPATPDAKTYRQAISFVLQNRRETDFETEKYLDALN